MTQGYPLGCEKYIPLYTYRPLGRSTKDNVAMGSTSENHPYKLILHGLWGPRYCLRGGAKKWVFLGGIFKEFCGNFLEIFLQKNSKCPIENIVIFW